MATDENRSPAVATEAALGHYGWERGVAAHRLPGSHANLPIAPLDDQQWQVLLEGVRRHWIWGLLDAAVADGALPSTNWQAKDAQTRALHAALADLAVEARLVSTSDLLREGGIEHRVMKGVTTAARVYPQPKLRSYGDVDVLVTGSSFDAAVRLLEQSGGKRRYAEARPGFDHRFSKGASFWMPDGISVDLHRTFVLGPFGFTVDLDGIFSRSDVVTIGGREIPCMDIVDAAVHACMHAGLGDWPPRLVPMRDVVHFLSDERVDLDALRERAGEWRCQAVVARAVLLTQSVYDFDDLPLSQWASRYRPRRWEQRTITLYGAGHTYRRQAIAATRFVPGGRAKLAYVKALTFPAPTYLREREGSVLQRGLRAVGIGDTIARPPAARQIVDHRFFDGRLSSSEVIANAVAAYGLPGTRTELPGSPLDPAAWQALLKAVDDQRIAGLLSRAIADGAMPATDEQAGSARQLEVDWAGHAVLLERLLLELSERLQRQGIPVIALKGSAFAHTVYPDPSLRSFGDVDVLVPGARFDDAIADLVAWGGRRRYPEPRPGFVGRFGKGAAIVMSDGFEIDLHRTFVAGPLGLRIDLDGLFATAVPMTIADRVLLRLANEEAFLHACYHTSLGGRSARLVPQRDVAQMLLTTELDLDRVHSLTAAWSGRAVVAHAVAEAWRTFALPEEHELARWSKGYVPTGAERRALSLYLGERRSYPRQMAAAATALPGWRNRAAYLHALLFPSRSYLATREGTYRCRLQHGLELARQAGRRPS